MMDKLQLSDIQINDAIDDFHKYGIDTKLTILCQLRDDNNLLKEQLNVLAKSIDTIVPYVQATLPSEHAKGCEYHKLVLSGSYDWAHAHIGRSGSSQRQLDKLLDQAHQVLVLLADASD